MSKTIAFSAYSKRGRQTRATPRDAATAFFQEFPDARKCDIVQGETDGQFFTVKYGRASVGEWPMHYKNVTKKTATVLPGAKKSE